MRTPRVQTLCDPRAVRALAQPARLAVLEALREPDSAAGVARAIGQSRQNVNYHLQELARARLVEHAGERRKGNFVEQLYRAVAHRFVVSPRFGWDPQRLEGALRDQASLARLVDLGARLSSDATALLDCAVSEGEPIASATVEAEVGFESAEERARFMNEYLAALGPLLNRYGVRGGARYRVALAVYPESDPSGAATTEDPA
jgi:DNA-binding transcriptional ArsR family regulator